MSDWIDRLDTQARSDMSALPAKVLRSIEAAIRADERASVLAIIDRFLALPGWSAVSQQDSDELRARLAAKGQR